MNEAESQEQKPEKPDAASLDTLTRSFLGVWRWLDDSPVRQIWPFALGAFLAFAAVQLTGRTLWAAGIVVLVYIGIYRTAAKATRHDQALRKNLD